MNPEDELTLWSQLFFQMNQVPNELRSMNHTAYLSEIEMRIHELAQEISTKD